MSTQVARLCARCHCYVPRALADTIRDGLGYGYTVCVDCLRPDDRVYHAPTRRWRLVGRRAGLSS